MSDRLASRNVAGRIRAIVGAIADWNLLIQVMLTLAILVGILGVVLFETCSGVSDRVAAIDESESGGPAAIEDSLVNEAE